MAAIQSITMPTTEFIRGDGLRYALVVHREGFLRDVEAVFVDRDMALSARARAIYEPSGYRGVSVWKIIDLETGEEVS